jgi:hypothetical protein
MIAVLPLLVVLVMNVAMTWWVGRRWTSPPQKAEVRRRGRE